MARIATGSIVADISGKVGDNIYSRNRGGPYVKEYAAPVQPGTAKQTQAQLFFSLAVSLWNGLSDLEYREWVAFSLLFEKSRFNFSKAKVEPRTFFIGCHINQRTSDGGGQPLPILPGNVGFTHIDISIPDATHLDVIWRGGVTDSDYTLTYYSTFAHPKTVRSINSVQQISFGNFNYLPDFTFPLFVAWNTAFPSGFPTNQQRIFISTKIHHFDSGILVGFGWDQAIGISGGVSPEAQAVLDRMTGLSQTEIDAIIVFVNAEVVNGNWALIDEFWCFGLTSEANALTGFFSITAINNGATKTSKGFDFVNGDYVDTNFNLSSASVNYELDDALIEIYLYERTAGSTFFGAQETPELCQLPRNGGTAMNTENQFSISPTPSDNKTLLAAGRLNSAFGIVYFDGSISQTVASVSTGIPDINLWIAKRSPAGGTDLTGVISTALIGANIGFNHTSHTTNINTLLTSLGVLP